MGVYTISPSNQAGNLHEPPARLCELCAPLHPLEFNLLFLMTHRGISSVSCGPLDEHEFDLQLRAVRLT